MGELIADAAAPAAQIENKKKERTDGRKEIGKNENEENEKKKESSHSHLAVKMC